MKVDEILTKEERRGLETSDYQWLAIMEKNPTPQNMARAKSHFEKLSTLTLSKWHSEAEHKMAKRANNAAKLILERMF